MAAKIGSFRHSFLERSKERLLSRKGYSDFGLNSSECGDERVKCGWFGKMSDGLVEFYNSVQEVSVKLYQMGRSDPRKAYFAAKMGLSLAIVSLLIFFKEPLKDASQYSILAILTVVVVFEFSIGATLNKGFNRALGTISAGGLALGIAELAAMAGTGRRDLMQMNIVLGVIICLVFLHQNGAAIQSPHTALGLKESLCPLFGGGRVGADGHVTCSGGVNLDPLSFGVVEDVYVLASEAPCTCELFEELIF